MWGKCSLLQAVHFLPQLSGSCSNGALQYEQKRLIRCQCSSCLPIPAMVICSGVIRSRKALNGSATSSGGICRPEGTAATCTARPCSVANDKGGCLRYSQAGQGPSGRNSWSCSSRISTVPPCSRTQTALSSCRRLGGGVQHKAVCRAWRLKGQIYGFGVAVLPYPVVPVSAGASGRQRQQRFAGSAEQGIRHGTLSFRTGVWP